MRQILMTTQNVAGDSAADTEEMIETARRMRVAQTMKYALVILANVPVLVAYPFVQKHFVKGVMVGAIKG
jgi:putative aldouronate transport system permease protein